MYIVHYCTAFDVTLDISTNKLGSL